MTHFGTATADGGIEQPIGVNADGIPIYCRLNVSSFLIVVEGRAGTSGSLPGQNLFNSVDGDPGAVPDLQIETNRDLGNGSSLVCDNGRHTASDVVGGIPGINPPSFASTQPIADALNDFGCRFAVHRTSDEACTYNDHGNPSFVAANTALQYCSEPGVGVEMAFPSGEDTLLTVQLRDGGGNIGDRAQIIVRAPCSPLTSASTFANGQSGG